MEKQKHLFCLHRIDVSVFPSTSSTCVVVICLDLRQISPIVLSHTPRVLSVHSESTDCDCAILLLVKKLPDLLQVPARLYTGTCYLSDRRDGGLCEVGGGSFKKVIQGSVSRQTIVPGVKKWYLRTIGQKNNRWKR